MPEMIAETKLKRSAWISTGGGIAVGLILVSAAKHMDRYPVLAAILEHLGAGAIVAAAVAIFFHVPEFSEFFTSVATRVLVDHQFLHKLNRDALQRLRAGIAAEWVKELVDNPEYDAKGVAEAGDALMYRNLLPRDKASGMYRTDFREFTTIRRLTPQQMYERLGKGVPLRGTADLPPELFEQTVITSYTVVAPSRERDDPFRVSLQSEVATLSIPEITERDQLRLWVRDGSGKERAVELECESRDGTRIYTCAKDENALRYLTEGVAKIWMKTVEYKLPGAEPFVLNTMSYPTRGAQISVEIDPAPASAPLRYRMFGFGGEPAVAIHERHRLELTYSNWFLEDHGYCVWW